MKEFIISCECWEGQDYSICIKPEKAKIWESIPIGMSMSKKDVQIVAEWLKTSLPTLQKLIIQTEKDPNV